MELVVVGLGHVGVITAASLARMGNSVIGVDIDPERVNSLNASIPPFYEPGLGELLSLLGKEGRARFAVLDQVDGITAPVVFICVGTPSQPNGAADLTYVRDTIKWVREKAQVPITIVMKSTVPPGTGRKLVSQYFGAENDSFAYVSNPEFLREGRAIEDWFQPDRIVIGGEKPDAVELVAGLFRGIKAPLIRTDTTSAELIKYAANAFLATKISFINEIANLCEKLGGDVTDVAHAVGIDPRIGADFLQAGIGYGGSCFPKDVRALDFLATSNGHSFELLRAVINVNNRQRLLPVCKIRERLCSLQGKVVAILGLAFKPNTDDVREAPALDIIRLLLDEGAKVQAYDPIANINASRILPSSVVYADSASEALTGAHAVVICTEWGEFSLLDWRGLFNRMEPPRAVIDGRNCLEGQALLRLGFDYMGIGRR